MNPMEKALFLQEKIEICHESFEDLNVKAQNISVSPLEYEYLTINYLLLRIGRQRQQLVNVVISLFDSNEHILQVAESSMFALKKRSLPYVGNVTMRLLYPFEKIAKIGVYLQER